MALAMAMLPKPAFLAFQSCIAVMKQQQQCMARCQWRWRHGAAGMSGNNYDYEGEEYDDNEEWQGEEGEDEGGDGEDEEEENRTWLEYRGDAKIQLSLADIQQELLKQCDAELPWTHLFESLEQQQVDLKERFGRDDMNQFRKVDRNTWYWLLQQLCANGKTGCGAEILEWLRHNGFFQSYDMLDALIIHGYGREKNSHSALQYAELRGYELGRRGYSALLNALIANKDCKRAFQVLDKMKSLGLPQDMRDFTHLMQVCGYGLADISTGCGHIKDMENSGVLIPRSVYCAAISACGKALKPDDGMYFLERLQASGEVAERHNYLSLMLALAKHGRTGEAEALIEEMKWCGIRPGIKAYNTLLASYSRQRQLEKIHQVKSSLEAAGVRLNCITYCVLIDAYAYAGRMDLLEDLYQEMREFGIQPNGYMYSRMIAIYRDTGQWDKALQLFQEIQDLGFPPHRLVYQEMIKLYVQMGQMDPACSLFSQVQGSDLKVDTWNTLINGLCKAGRPEDGKNMYFRMLREGYTAIERTFNILIHGFGVRYRWNDVNLILEEMRAKGLFPNEVTYASLVDAYAQAGKFKDALDCLSAMEDNGLKSRSAYSALANGYARRGRFEQTVELLQKMETLNFEMDLPLLNVLLNAYSNARKDEEAMTVFEYIKEAGFTPDSITYTTLMKAYLRTEKLNEVADIYEEMVQAGCEEVNVKQMVKDAFRNRTLSPELEIFASKFLEEATSD